MNDAREIIVQKNHVGGFLANIGTGDIHGNAMGDICQEGLPNLIFVLTRDRLS